MFFQNEKFWWMKIWASLGILQKKIRENKSTDNWILLPTFWKARSKYITKIPKQCVGGGGGRGSMHVCELQALVWYP